MKLDPIMSENTRLLGEVQEILNTQTYSISKEIPINPQQQPIEEVEEVLVEEEEEIPEEPKPVAFTTLISYGYWKQGLVLVKNVREVGNSHEKFLIITTSKKFEDDIEDRFHQLNAEIIYIEEVPVPPNVIITKGSWRYSWNKLHGFLLTEYSKLIHLDVDMVISHEISEMFGFPPFTTAPGQCHPCATNHGTNGGVLVYEPNIDVYKDLLKLATQPHPNHWSGSEQNLLDAYFMHGRQTLEPRIKGHLMSGLYNTVPGSCECMSEAVTRDHVKIWHFACSAKPWERPKSDWKNDHNCQAVIALRWFDTLESLGLSL